MKFIILVIGLLLLISGSLVSAGDVNISTDKSEYVFYVGDEARIPFLIESSFQAPNVGTLSYTLTQTQRRSAVSFSQTSTKSQTFPISPGLSQNALSITSEEPTEYEVILSIKFRDEGKDYSSDLPPITVRFIENQLNQQNSAQTGSQNQAAGSPLHSATSEETPASSQGTGSSPINEIEQQMNAIRQQNQQLMQQVLSPQGMSSVSQQQTSQYTPQQALQNNQMNAQSSALQQQLFREVAEDEELKQELSKKIEGDQLLRRMAEALSDAGYKQTEGRLTPSGNDAGTFDASYTDQNGSQLQVRGDINAGSIQKITAQSEENLPVPKKLADDPRYQTIQSGLNQSGYQESYGSLEMTRNETRIIQEFRDQEGKNATISSLIRNGTVEEVNLQKDENAPTGWIIGIILLVILLAICIWAGYRYYQRREPAPQPEEEVVPEEPVDILDATLRMLEEAEVEIAGGRMKPAYILAGQALRFYISHSLGSGSAQTSEEILLLTRDTSLPEEMITDILNRCLLVEFAREEGNREELSWIVGKIREMVQQNSSASEIRGESAEEV